MLLATLGVVAALAFVLGLCEPQMTWPNVEKTRLPQLDMTLNLLTFQLPI